MHANAEPERPEPAAGQILDVILILVFWPIYLVGWLINALWRLLIKRDI